MKKSESKNNNLQNNSVSVVVPVRNGEKTISACLKAILNQTLIPYEIIVVDNGSLDNTKKILEKFAAQYQNLKIIFEPCPGRGRARNAGICEAQGNIIAMTDADCIVPKNWIEKITAPIIKSNALAVMGFEYTLQKNYWSKMRQKEDERFIFSKYDGKYIYHLDTKNFAIKASIAKAILFNPDLSAYEDWDFFLRLSSQNIQITFLPDLQVAHYHKTSALELWKTQYERARGMYQALLTHKKDEKLKNILKKDESASTVKLKNFITFLPWAVFKIFTKPKQAPFLIIADLAWKSGVMSSFFSKKIKQVKFLLQQKMYKIQMHPSELFKISLSIKNPMQILVFGVGNDSIIWHRLNKNGKTVFIEDNPYWIKLIKKRYPFLKIYQVSYKTKAKDWEKYFKNEKLLPLTLPKEIREIFWDLIIVDGPAGYSQNTPGRMKSIYEASRLIKCGGIVFIHDSEREIEQKYGEKFLGKENIIEEMWGRALLRKYQKRCF